jgi:hypothetical protein
LSIFDAGRRDFPNTRSLIISLKLYRFDSALDCEAVLVVVVDIDVAFSWGPPKRSFQKYDHILPSLAMV